ncbi:imidazoleglycerol phosphate dehydratase [Penicillium macrosclerotiorum]|uniref:imidazoleglycerol phosphate dehydratase n=1 Tax=Penicillium macrosclerotiorum TaxID=303699 RepID=UPI002546E38C|nr:imidazoleglycerol phosphate dehydratase [Penicillium macrosclerotiorum]KAJ5674159.1 imidazoleglycerol phosphate dehydratase [Penicillium macrosclerotiorum]
MSSALTARKVLVERITNETSVQVSLSLDGGELDLLPYNKKFDSLPEQTTVHHASQNSPTQKIWIWTGIGFLDHMIHALAKHSGWSLRVRTVGDLAIDDHHTAEDTFLALGEAFSKALGDRKGIRRFGDGHAPLDEALARAVLDISSRPYFVGTFDFKDSKIGSLSTQMIPHCLQSFSQAAAVTLHVDVLRGENDHHRAEAAFKALAIACRASTERITGKEGEVVSTKGVLSGYK